MPGFNLRKTTAQSKIHDKMLGDQQKEVGTSIGSTTETIQSHLEGVRGEGQGENLDIVTEGQMQEPHKAATSADQVTQGQLSSSDNRHRDPNVDDAIMKPMDALAEARHQQHAEAYAADNKPDRETKFWDDFVGTQMERKPHKVIAADPGSASQLHNHPDRFKNLSSNPTEVDVRNNEKSLDNKDNVEDMTMASIGDLDKQIFATFYGAASESRELTESEAGDIVSLSEAKVGILNLIKNIAEEE